MPKMSRRGEMCRKLPKQMTNPRQPRADCTFCLRGHRLCSIPDHPVHLGGGPIDKLNKMRAEEYNTKSMPIRDLYLGWRPPVFFSLYLLLHVLHFCIYLNIRDNFSLISNEM